MSLLNFANGLSEMGKSVADTAGTMSLNLQKADLEKQSAVLANQLATTREHVGRVESGDIAAKAAGVQQQFEAGQQTERLGTEKELETGREKNAVKIAGMNIAGENARSAAAINAGATDITTDNDGNTVIVNKVTGKTSTLTGPDGKTPLNLVNPQQAALARDVVASTNEQVRAATQQYRISSTNAQKDVADALKAAAGDQKDQDVIDARARQKAITDQFNDEIKTLNDNVNAAVNAALHPPRPAPGGATPGTPPAAPGAGTAPQPLAVPPAFAGKPEGTVLSKGGKNYVIRGGQLVPQ